MIVRAGSPVPRFGGFPVEGRVFRRFASGRFDVPTSAAEDFSSPRPSKNERGKTFFSSFDAISDVFVRKIRFGRRNRRVSRRKIPFEGGATVRFVRLWSNAERNRSPLAQDLAFRGRERSLSTSDASRMAGEISSLFSYFGAVRAFVFQCNPL